MSEGSMKSGLVNRITTNHRFMAFLRASRIHTPLRRLYYRWYATRRLRFYSSFVKQNDLVYDIGANIGTMLGTFLDLGARVVAVEPQIKLYQDLVRRFGSDGRVHLVWGGVDKEEGTGTIYLSESDAIASMSKDWISNVKESGRFGSLQWYGTEEIPVVTLDKLIRQFGTPAFCKIDVEGYELRVAEGLRNSIPCLSFEFNPELRQDAEHIIRHLAEIGDYSFNFCVGEPTKLELAQWEGPESMILRLGNIPKGHLDILAKVRQAGFKP